ncbi:GT-D fold domain-containing glycosyltransferase [Scopulibacillus cellulosilyticus]|uniref:GT-D fold domain-containing glycosyltransferase n=1 Tax=Scopulibacillus cellulosilyticus TaxID=2665665 RepID=A0ABW2Q1A2_9BACL
MIPDEQFLTVDQVLEKLIKAIEESKPLSLVRIGDGENIVLAQDSVMTVENVLKEKWAQKANQDRKLKGVTLPNLTLRDQMVDAIKAADIVGIPFYKNDPILTENRLKRELTDQVFSYFQINPQMVCHTFVNRVFAQKKQFWKELRSKKIMLIGQWSEQASQLLREKPYKMNICINLPFDHNYQMDHTLETIRINKDNFDIALISCGVNSVVIAQKVAEMTGKIGIDFGKSLMFMVQGKAGLTHSSRGAKIDLLP